MSAVFVTGHRGKLGRLVAENLSADRQVIGFDTKENKRDDIRDLERILDRMPSGCDVVHTAAIPHPGKGDMARYVDINVTGAFNVMRAAASKGARRFVFFSSVGWYGCNLDGRLNPQYLPIDERHPTASMSGCSEGALSEYNTSKVLAEELLAHFGSHGAFEAIALRFAPANAKASQYPEHNEWKANPRYREKALWTNVDPASVADATRLALEAPDAIAYEAFNIVDRYTHRNVDLASFIVETYPGVPLKPGWSPPESLFSPVKAMRMLGFRPSEAVA